MMGFGSTEPWFEMDLPGPIIVDAAYLVGFYAVILACDYFLLRYEAKVPLSRVQLRVVLAIVHSLLPMAVVSPWAPYNLFFAAMPWFYVSYTAILPVDRLSCREWLYSFYAVLLDIPDDERRRIAFAHNAQLGSGTDDPMAARKAGLVKLIRGAFKFWFMKHVIDRILPEDYTVLLRLPWFSAGSLMLTVVLGIKAYLMLGVVDLGLGLEQCVLGVPLIDLQDSPILSASPRDFWSRRWNKIVRNLLHQLIFMRAAHPDPKHGQKTTSPWKRNLRGLLVFFVSGVFHEMIIMSICRKMTLENLIFFTLHGVAVLFELTLRDRFHCKGYPRGMMRVLSVALHLLFLAATGRLFLAPFVRYDFMGIRESTFF
ncbi:hypothetical protein BCR43DRAFT_488342 [Syncephalastrum racemosum]|uniref:Wax synthase domain-containing protein n=1 Tax=Syncephalastrum racemosum TaxID=13706 RepID=A0A1X2HIG6_SYNRA|nr:hypothetical protein BCR43DRAFT_488342 [Syncephalastrum racemosum]